MRKAPVQIGPHWLVALLEKLRTKHGVSQREMSAKCGMSPGWWMQVAGYGRIRGLAPLERALAIFGYELKAVRKDPAREPAE